MQDYCNLIKVNCTKGNLVTQVDKWMKEVGINMDDKWSLIDNKTEMAETIKIRLKQDDWNRSGISIYNRKYVKIKSNDEKYPTDRIHIETQRIIAQARTAGKFVYFYFGNKPYL